MFSASSYDVGLLNNKAKPTGAWETNEPFWRKGRRMEIGSSWQSFDTRRGKNTNFGTSKRKVKQKAKKNLCSPFLFFIHTFMLYSQCDGHFGLIVIVFSRADG